MIATVTINSIRVKPVSRCMGAPFLLRLNDRELGEFAANPPDEWPKSEYVRHLRRNFSGISSRFRSVTPGRTRRITSELDRVQVLVYNGFREKTAQPKSRKYRPAAASARHHADAPAHGNRPCAVHAARAPLGGSDPEVGQLALRRNVEGDRLQHAETVPGKETDPGACRGSGQNRLR